ncbi:RHS repeat domain-containing protein [Pseudoalteromonas aurantia]|uniref:Uncharacterized protein n=1 Tax=Pseudoalteromonas aurantia 208 TaxID=1314867 RepID=A0ABR9ELH1_9GAMM|nr:RHS repeat-associated core domain-containing protein [Pseudoalteromonas aurantia]MBE0371105.1 hypothetical protein [Pseudoalteromonas aurantia 208]
MTYNKLYSLMVKGCCLSWALNMGSALADTGIIPPSAKDKQASEQTLLKNHISDFPTERISIQGLKLEHTFVTGRIPFPSGKEVVVGYKVKGFRNGAVFPFFGFDESRHGFKLIGTTSKVGQRSIKTMGCLGAVAGIDFQTTSDTGRQSSAPQGSTAGTRSTQDLAVFQGGAVLRCDSNAKPMVLYPDGMQVKFGAKQVDGNYLRWPLESLQDQFGNSVSVSGGKLTIGNITSELGFDTKGLLESITLTDDTDTYVTNFYYDALNQIDYVLDAEKQRTDFTHTGVYTGGGTSIKSITLPSKLKVTYDYAGYWEGSRNSLTVTAKDITGPNVAPRSFIYRRVNPEVGYPGAAGHRVWVYEYAKDDNGNNVVTENGVSDVYYIHGSDYHGKIYKRERYYGPNETGMELHSKWEQQSLLLRQEVLWEQASVGTELCLKQLNPPYYEFAYINGCKVVRKKREYTSYKMEGGYDTYGTHYKKYEAFNLPWEVQHTRFSSTTLPTEDITNMQFQGDSKYIKYGYTSSTASRLIGNVSSVWVSETDVASKYTQVSKTSYHFGRPKEVYKFGLLQSTSSYHSHGGLKSIHYNVLQDTNTLNRNQHFDSTYYGNVPENTTSRRPHSNNTMSIKQVANGLGWVTSVNNFNGGITSTTFDKLGRVASKQSIRDIARDIDWQGELVEWPSAVKQVITTCVLNTEKTACTNDQTFKVVKHFDANMNTIKQEWHDLVNTQATTSSRYQRFEYNKYGQVTFASNISTSNAETLGTHTDYDESRRKKSVTQDGRGTVHFTYLTGNKIKVTDARNHTTTTTYEAFIAPTYELVNKLESPNGLVTNTELDAFGLAHKVSQIGKDQDGKLTTFTEERKFNEYKQLCLVIRKDVGNVLIGRNALGEATWKKFGSSATECVDEAPAGSVFFTYDNVGSIRTVDYVDDKLDKTYSYDRNSNLTELVVGDVTHTYSYNNQDLLEKETLQLVGEQPLVLDYRYNAAKHIQQQVYPDNTIVEFDPNGFGKAQSVTAVTSEGTELQVFASDVEYYVNGAISGFTYGNGVKHSLSFYDDSQRPKALSDKQGNAHLVHLSYSYDNNDNITKILDGANTSAYSLTNLKYDSLDRLTATTGGQSIGSSALEYDDFGNILKYSSKGRALSYTYNAKNQLSSVSGISGKYDNIQYDSRGNIKHNGAFALQFNDANQLKSAKGNTYVYDGHNYRVISNDNNGKSYSFYSKSGVLVYQETSENLSLEGTNNIYLSGKLIAKYGDVQPKTLAESKQHYKPFGETINAAQDDIGFTGHKFDTDLNLSYMQARYYDPVIGRFYSNDPIGFRDMHSFNRYVYANNNPYKYIDPTGMFVVYYGGTGSGNAGVSGAGAIGSFVDISFDGLEWGVYSSIEGGAHSGLPGVSGGVEFGFFTGKWQKAMTGEYVLAGAEAKALAGGSVAGVMTVGKDPEYGVQVSLFGGTPNAAGFMHRGYGEATDIGGVNFKKLGELIDATVDDLIDAAAQPMGQTAPNPTGKGSRPGFRNSLSHRGNMTKRKQGSSR